MYDQSWNPSEGQAYYNPIKDGELDPMSLRRFAPNAWYRGHAVENPEYQWDLGNPWEGMGYSYDPANPTNEMDFEGVSFDPRNPYNMPLEYDDQWFVSNEAEFNPALGSDPISQVSYEPESKGYPSNGTGLLGVAQSY